MAAGGYYNLHSQTQAAALKFALPYLKDAAEAVPIPQNGREFNIVDLGSAQGRNSLVPMRLVLEILRERQEFPFPVRITHTDQVENDFSTLFAMLQSDPQSYLRGLGEVYPYAIGSSFYQRLFPESDIDLAWSSIALHWLSRVAVKLKNHFWSSLASGPDRHAIEEQAKEDWANFLRCRAVELKPEASMVIVAGAANELGECGGEPMLECVNRVLIAMMQEGVLSSREYQDFNLPIYNRRQRDFLAPFRSDSLGPCYEVVGSRLDKAEDAHCAQFQKDGNVEAFADGLAGFFRGFTQTLFADALDKGRSAEARAALVESFYARLREAFFKNPQSVQYFWYVFSLHLRRTEVKV